MVRAALGLLLCSQHALSDSALMQTQSQSDHILDALHTGSGRVKKMQENTQAMENQYKALLQNIVDAKSLTDPKTGTPFLPADNFFTVVDAQFKSLLDELDTEKGANNQIIVTAHDAVKACNSVMETRVGEIVKAELSKVRVDRKEHANCRSAEDSAISSMETECDTFDRLAAKCSQNQDWYAKYNDHGIASVESNTLTAVVDQAEVCKNKVDTQTDQANSCDTAQGTFKTAYCKYETALSTACVEHGDCYDRDYKSLQGTIASVKELEGEQKTIYKMVKKVQCYIEKLRFAKDAMPTQDDIDECIKSNPTTTPLDITYPDIEPRSECQKNDQIGTDPLDAANSKYKPGNAGGSWYAGEFTSQGMDLHDKLNSDCQCHEKCK